MRIDYHDLHESQFEDLTVAICKKILGTGTQKFAQGPDGGRDAKFEGTANCYPSTSNSYTGKFIIQAKLTHNPIAKISDSDFYSDTSTTCVVAKEKKRLVKLISNKEIDHYILFTNRRQSANLSVKIEKELKALGLKSANLCGVENLDMFLKEYPAVFDIAEINFLDEPLRVIPDELAEIILHFKKEILNFKKNDTGLEEIKRTKFEKKCDLNNVMEEYKKHILKYMADFNKINQFLEIPANSEFQDMYIETSEAFNLEILERIDDNSLPTLINSLWYRLVTRDGDLSKNRRLTRAILYYMFWNCDIGIENAETK